MMAIFVWTIFFTIATALSVTLIGARDLVSGNITPLRMIEIIFDWRFILGAAFAFCARLFFIMINNSVYKISHLSESATTVTFFITTISIVFVVISNYLFLHERLNATQLFGSLIMIFGIFLLVR